MFKRLAWLLSGGAVVLGLGHLSIAAMSFEQLSFDALWFAGSGLAIVVAGLFNLFALGASVDRKGGLILGIANLATSGFFAMALSIMPAPQVIVGLILFGGLTMLSWRPGVTGPDGQAISA